MKQSNKKSPLVFRVGLLLLCIMLLSLCLMGGLYARYSTTVKGHSATSVAKFDVTSSCIYDPATDRYMLTIKNDSAVTVSYDIRYTVGGAVLSDSVTITFEHGNSGTLGYGESISGSLFVSENYGSYHENESVDVNVTVTQID